MSKILCPVDFSDTSLNAIEFATEVAIKQRSVLTLVNVFTEHEFNTIVGKDKVSKTYKQLLGIATNRLNNIAEAIREDAGKRGLLKCDAEVLLGELHESILQKCSQEDYDMLVMGTTGLGRGFWVGSNTSMMIQKSPISVLCVPKKSSFSGFRKIVYATDIQEADKLMMQEIINMATLFNSRVSVLHVNQHNNTLEDYILNEFFDELKSFLKYDKIGFDSITYKGDLSQGLLEYMRDNKADLLSVFSKRRNYVENLIHKSVSKKLSVLSEQPLLVLK